MSSHLDVIARDPPNLEDVFNQILGLSCETESLFLCIANLVCCEFVRHPIIIFNGSLNHHFNRIYLFQTFILLPPFEPMVVDATTSVVEMLIQRCVESDTVTYNSFIDG